MSWMIILLIFHSIRWLWLHVCGYSYLWFYTWSDVIRYRFCICPFSGYTVFVISTSNRVAILGQKSINGSIKWLGITAPFCDTGVAWTNNFLVTEALWGDRGTVETWDLGNKSGVCFSGVDVPWRGAVLFCAVYLPRSPENACATAHRLRDIRLWEHRLARAGHL